MQKDDPSVQLPRKYHKLSDLSKAGAIMQAIINKKVEHVLSTMYGFSGGGVGYVSTDKQITPLQGVGCPPRCRG